MVGVSEHGGVDVRAGGLTLTLQGVINILPLPRGHSCQFAVGDGALG